MHTGDEIGLPLRAHGSSKVHALAYSPDGRHIISGSEDGTLQLWNAQSGAEVWSIPRAHDKAVQSVAYSPDGRHIVSGTYDPTLRRWDAQTGNPDRVDFSGHVKGLSIWTLSYSPNGQYVLSGSGDRTLCMWNAQTGELIGTLPVSSIVWSLAYSLDGRHAAFCTMDA